MFETFTFKSLYYEYGQILSKYTTSIIQFEYIIQSNTRFNQNLILVWK